MDAEAIAIATRQGLLERTVYQFKRLLAESAPQGGISVRIDIVTRNIRREKPIRGFIQQKLGFALEKVNSNIEQVNVRLEDQTRKSNAFDGRCTIDATLSPGGTIHVSAKAESAFECVVIAVRKLEQAIRNDLDRARKTSRGRQKKAQQAFLSELAASDDPVAVT